MKPKEIPGVPPHEKGKFHDTVEETLCKRKSEAKRKFHFLRQRLLNVNAWGDYVKNSTVFYLTDSNGKPIEREAKPGDYIRIKISGPANPAGNGFDWVTIQEIDTDNYECDQRLLLRCVPCNNPKTKKDQPAHFYTSEASSSFIITRKERVLTAEIHGRNEEWNIHTGSFINRFRNGIIASGAFLGFAKIQWTLLAKAFINFK